MPLLTKLFPPAIKYGLVSVLWLASVIGAYVLGVNNTREELEIERGRQATQVIERVEERIPVVREQDTENRATQRELARLREELRRAINENSNNELPSCDLSDDEWMLFNELSERARVLSGSSVHRD